MATIRCAHCKGTHSSVGEVKDCARGVRPSAPVVTAPAPAPASQSGVPFGAVEQKALPPAGNGVTQRQLDYIRDLGGDVQLALRYTMRGASLYIDRLKREGKKVTTPSTPEPNSRRSTKIPMELLEGLRDGYYASRPDSTRNFTFFRVSRPNRGHFKGSLKIQTQHGPELKLYMIVTPDNRVYKYSDFPQYEDDLLLVTVDMRGCAIAYAEQIGKCMRCNAELTDERSRWFGIGPECEKHWPEILQEIEETKGPFKHGWEG